AARALHLGQSHSHGTPLSSYRLAHSMFWEREANERQDMVPAARFSLHPPARTREGEVDPLFSAGRPCQRNETPSVPSVKKLGTVASRRVRAHLAPGACGRQPATTVGRRRTVEEVWPALTAAYAIWECMRGVQGTGPEGRRGQDDQDDYTASLGSGRKSWHMGEGRNGGLAGSRCLLLNFLAPAHRHGHHRHRHGLADEAAS
ncbi:MAG: hypothetical protein Q9157_008003, partial [Trypethelium eluteriae]